MSVRPDGGGAHRRVRRLPALVAIIALLVAGGLVDRRARPKVQLAAGARQLDSLMPAAASTKALTSAWYCPGATAVAKGSADGTLIVANPTDQPLDAMLTLVPVQGDPVGVPFTVGPYSRSVIHEADKIQAAQVAALVDFNGGGGVVEQIVAGPLGGAVMPCASESSDHWYFATGSTDRDDTLTLMLFNPFPGDAIVDLSFATDQGPTAPPDFQGLVVPARAMRAVDIGEHVRRRVDVATTVTARSGRVVASQLQLHTAAPTAVTALLGAPSPGPLWMFPDGLAGDGVKEQYHIYNPSPQDARVSIELGLDQGEAEPFDLTIPAFGTYVLAANDEPRIPKNVAHAATVRSTNGVGVVAERSFATGPPATRTGQAVLLGARRSARQWVLAAGNATAGLDEWLVLWNPGPAPAKVSVTALAAGVPLPVEGLDEVEVPAGRRVAVRLGDHISRDDLGLRVSSTAPVVLERDEYVVSGAGLIASIGLPAG